MYLEYLYTSLNKHKSFKCKLCICYFLTREYIKLDQNKTRSNVLRVNSIVWIQPINLTEQLSTMDAKKFRLWIVYSFFILNKLIRWFQIWNSVFHFYCKCTNISDSGTQKLASVTWYSLTWIKIKQRHFSGFIHAVTGILRALEEQRCSLCVRPYFCCIYFCSYS